jgi:hypothetical protein
MHDLVLIYELDPVSPGTKAQLDWWRTHGATKAVPFQNPMYESREGG